jgi:DNA-binding Xre family transcriptional regulator
MPVKPCGTRASYARGCRCTACSHAAVTYHKIRSASRSRGESAWGETPEVIDHIEWLNSRGLGDRSIAELAGVDRSTITRIRDGRTTRIQGRTAEAILSVNTVNAQPETLVDAKRSRRQCLDLLSVMTAKELAAQLGYSGRTVPLLHHRRKFVTRRTASTIDALWRRRIS